MSDHTGELRTLCVIRCNGALYGLPAASIHEVLEWRTPVRVPLAPAHISGVIVHQGDVLTVLRLACLLADCTGTDSAMLVLEDFSTEERFVLSVDSVEQILAVAETDIHATPQSLIPRLQSLFSGICRCSGEPVFLLDPSRLSPNMMSGELELSNVAGASVCGP